MLTSGSIIEDLELLDCMSTFGRNSTTLVVWLMRTLCLLELSDHQCHEEDLSELRRSQNVDGMKLVPPINLLAYSDEHQNE